MSKGKALIGLAMGGGAARGLAHIGALSFFEEQGLPIDVVTGTSIGAIIGAVYAAGTDLNWLEKLAVSLDWDQLVDLTVPRMGFFKTEKLFQLIELLCKHKNIEELDILYRAVAVDIENGEEVVLGAGELAKAAVSSASIPGVFLPYEFQGRKLVDGGLRNRVPIKPAKDAGADVVIAVDVASPVLTMQPKSVVDIILQSIDIMQQEINMDKVSQADILIQPDLSGVSPFDLRSASYAISAGREAAQNQWEEICALLARVGRSCHERRLSHGNRVIGPKTGS